MVNHPTTVQQWAMAYAIKPTALLSLFSSFYVIYFLLIAHPDKLKRMYHRLVLAMNINVVPMTIKFLWGTWAIPKGTPYTIGAIGTRQTCTTQGFLGIFSIFTVSYYYASLSVFAFLAVKHSFKEAEFQWVEKWIHIGAYVLPLTVAVVLVTKEQFNPYAEGCFATGYPVGCEYDPHVPCERGDDDSEPFIFTLGVGQFLTYFVIPPVAMLSIRSRISAVREDVDRSLGFKRIMESARQRALKDVAAQTTLYLFSFWSTYIIGLIATMCFVLTGKVFYNLVIIGSILLSSQGTVIAYVYFRLNNIGKPNVMVVPNSSTYHPSHKTSQASSNANQTVADIRTSAASPDRSRRGADSILSSLSTLPSERFAFHIFDGTPDENSPWSQFLNPGSHDEDDDCSESPCDFLENEKAQTQLRRVVEGTTIASGEYSVGSMDNALVSV